MDVFQAYIPHDRRLALAYGEGFLLIDCKVQHYHRTSLVSPH